MFPKQELLTSLPLAPHASIMNLQTTTTTKTTVTVLTTTTTATVTATTTTTTEHFVSSQHKLLTFVASCSTPHVSTSSNNRCWTKHITIITKGQYDPNYSSYWSTLVGVACAPLTTPPASFSPPLLSLSLYRHLVIHALKDCFQF